MYTIGEISKIVNISTNTLRYYDEIGLLKPSLVKHNNQYRYYSDSQIKDIIFIIEMKQYGFNLTEIKKLSETNDNKFLKYMLEEKRYKLLDEITKLKDMSTLLEKRIYEILKEDTWKMKNEKVLIVDDLKLSRVIIKNIIEKYGYIVIGEANNGQEALLAYEKLNPDIVIMDIVMPIMDGIDATMKIMEMDRNAKIIICSANSCPSIIVKSIKAGAKDFIYKPICSFRLTNAIAKSLTNNCDFTLNNIDHIFNIITNNYKEVSINKILNQEEIDTFINKIILGNQSNSLIHNFFNRIAQNYNDENKFLISKSTKIEEDLIIYLNNKFSELSKVLSFYLSNSFHESYLVNLLTVENITMQEFKTLIDTDTPTGIINYNSPSSSIYINLHRKMEDEHELIKEFIDFIAKYFNSFFPNYSTTELISNSNALKTSFSNFPTILISFSLEVSGENSNYISIGIPHNLLYSLNL